MPFERFEKTANSRNVRYKSLLSIYKCKTITFYAALCRELIPEGSTYVNLYFDKEANRIGLKFIPERERQSFSKKLSKHTQGPTPMWISCKPFLAYTEFNILERTFFKPEKKDDLITIDLNNPVKLEDL